MLNLLVFVCCWRSKIMGEKSSIYAQTFAIELCMSHISPPWSWPNFLFKICEIHTFSYVAGRSNYEKKFNSTHGNMAIEWRKELMQKFGGDICYLPSHGVIAKIALWPWPTLWRWTFKMFRQICKILSMAMGLSISVSVCVCVSNCYNCWHMSHFSKNQKC